jgi:hypothetical protein
MAIKYGNNIKSMHNLGIQKRFTIGNIYQENKIFDEAIKFYKMAIQNGLVNSMNSLGKFILILILKVIFIYFYFI